MKSYKYLIPIIAIATLLVSSTSFAENYYTIGTGNGGDAEVSNVSLETGLLTSSPQKGNYLFAISVPIIDHGDIKVPGTMYSSLPDHNTYTDYGTSNDGIETGLIAKAGKGFGNGTIFFSVIGGVTQSNVVNIVKSDIGDQYYEQSADNEMYEVYGAGISYFHSFFDWGLKMNFQIDYDNRRGITSSIGWNW